MSLPELMQEMTGGNSGVIQQINQLTGMDNVNQLDLSDKTLSTSSIVNPTAVASNGATAPTNQTSPVEIPTQEKTDTNQSSQTEASSTESSGNLNDFEW
jgi:type VI secretion system protein ImpA